MSGKPQEPKQKTPKGLEIPVPKRREVMDAFRKIMRPSQDAVATILASTEPFECQECHWTGRMSDLRRESDTRGGIELACPNCGQAHYSFPP